MSRSLLWLLCLTLLFAVIHVRGEEFADETQEEPPKKSVSTKKTTTATPDKKANAAKPPATEEEPIASINNVSPSRLFLSNAIMEYTTLSGRFSMKRSECRELLDKMGLPPVLGTYALIYHPDGNKLPGVHKQLKEVSEKLAARIKCEKENQVLWSNADILMAAIENGYREANKEAASTSEQNAQSTTGTTGKQEL